MVYKIIKDFNHTTSEDKILTLKEGTAIDRKEGEEYIIKQGRQKELRVKASLIENNPDYFEKVDLNSRLLALLKKAKPKTVNKTVNVVTDFLDEEYLKGKDLVDEDILSIALDACRLQFITTEDKKWLVPIQELDWDIDAKGVYKK